jgi:hypothetical protein
LDVLARMNPEGCAPTRHKRRAGGSLAVAALALAAVSLGLVALVALDANALCLLPALALAVPLLMRRYPGERILTNLSGAPQVRWPRPRSSTPHGERRFASAPHGGSLIAQALAVRPPPALGVAI